MLESPLQPAKGFRFTAQAKNIHSLGQSKERGQKKKKRKTEHSASYKFYPGEVYFKSGLWQTNLLDAAVYYDSFKVSLASLGAWA